MAYDQGLATRLRDVLADEPGITEKKMFGGVAFMAGGNMACGVNKDLLLVRVGKDGHDEAMRMPGVKVMDFTGSRPMVGWVTVDPSVTVDDGAFQEWVDRGLAHARSLPPK